MNSIVGFVVGLLQATLSMLGFVQQHPEIPVDQQQQATQVAQEAVTQATQAVSKTGVSITYPKNGDILHQDQKVNVTWKVAQSILDTVPPDFDANVFIYSNKKNDARGVPNSSSAGDGSPAAAGTAVWDIAHARWDSSGKYAVPLDPGTYEMHAQLQITPKDQKRMCAKTVNKDCMPDDAAAAVIASFGDIHSETVTFTIATPETSDSSVPGMKIYTNSQYGFSVQYSSKYVPDSPANGGVVSWYSSEPIFSLPYEKGTYEQSKFVIYATSSPDQSVCMGGLINGTFENPASPTNRTTINDISFLTYSVGDGGLGQWQGSKVYKTWHNGSCIYLAVNSNGTEYGHLGEAEKKVYDSDHARLSAIFDPVVQSFEFIESASISGMSKYTDSDFGFSFWYPSGWSVTEHSNSASNTYQNGEYAGIISIDSPDNSHKLTIQKVTSNDLTYRVNAGPCGYCGPVNYFFDPGQHLWMKVYPNGPNGAPDMTPDQFAAGKLPQVADVSHNTMGGLHMFSTEQKESAVIIPLSARNFLLVSDNTYTEQCGRACGPQVKGGAQYLAGTVVASDPSVATPLSATEQTSTIQAEKDAYSAALSSKPAQICLWECGPGYVHGDTCFSCVPAQQ